MEFRNNITNINDLHVGEVYMDAQTRQLYIVTEEGTHTQLLSDFAEEGFRNFDSKTLTEEETSWLEEHFIDFAREQYLVRQDDMREALKIATILEGTIGQS